MPMMLGELLDNGDIPTRLHNGLLNEFRKRLYEPLENMDLEKNVVIQSTHVP